SSELLNAAALRALPDLSSSAGRLRHHQRDVSKDRQRCRSLWLPPPLWPNRGQSAWPSRASWHPRPRSARSHPEVSLQSSSIFLRFRGRIPPVLWANAGPIPLTPVHSLQKSARTSFGKVDGNRPPTRRL